MDDCIFCKIVTGEAGSWKVHENERVVAFLDINPINEYHTLVIPKAHYENIFDAPEDELLEVMRVVKKLTNLYRSRSGIQNVQIISCAGAEAQQDVSHFHVHIVPRKKGDGQNVRWKMHPEWRDRFDELLNKLKNGNLIDEP